MNVNIAVIYYSSTGNVHQLARAVEQGASGAGATVRLRKAPEIASDNVVNGVPAWRAHLDQTADVVDVSLADLVWADAYAFGTPTRFGNVAAQLRQFLDSTSGPWSAGELADKPVSGFTCSGSPHGGQESTLLSMYQTFMHWGAFIIPMGYTDPIIDAAGGNPYGVSSLDSGTVPTPEALAAARYQGLRLATVAQTLARGREQTGPAGSTNTELFHTFSDKSRSLG